MEIEKLISDGVDQEIINSSKYSWQIAEYYNRFPTDNIMLLNFEDLKNGSVTLTQNICHFLEIDSSYPFKVLKNIHHNRKSKRLTTSWRELNIPMKKNISYLSGKIPFKYKQIIHNVFGKERESYFELSREQKKKIISELEGDLKQLEQDYGFDVSKWKINI